jgi:ribosomal peptide maturation radical SAM protein 1
MTDAVLLIPPFVSGNRPSLSLGIMKSMFASCGIDSTIIHSNLHFKRKVDEKLYEEISLMFNHIDLAEFVFAGQAFPETADKQRLFFDKIKNKNPEIAGRMLALARIAGDFTDAIAELVVMQSPKILITNCFMKQVTATIAISGAVKKKDPGIITAVYGYSFRQPAGTEIIRHTRAIDHVLDGDPENTIIGFYHDAVAGKIKPGGVIEYDPVTSLDDLPTPDYTDYFRELDDLWFKHTKRTVCLESSRGCLWGAKNSCLFCGQGNGSRYVVKSPERFSAELADLAGRYEPEQMQTGDYLMPADYPEKVYANIKPLNVKNLFYELSPLTSIGNLEIMKSAGMNICQPGIESLNDGILGILNKNTDAVMNVRFLRDCKIKKVKPMWNMICRVPGETAGAYLDMADNVIPFVFHLQPPQNIRPIYIQKNSPLVLNPEKYGLKNIRPYEIYDCIFPDGANTSDISPFFTADYPSAFDDMRLKQYFSDLMKRWADSYSEGKTALLLTTKNGKMFVRDTRNVQDAAQFEIGSKHIDLLKRSFLPVGESELLSAAEDGNSMKELDELLDMKVILKISGRYISLVEQNFS